MKKSGLLADGCGCIKAVGRERQKEAEKLIRQALTLRQELFSAFGKESSSPAPVSLSIKQHERNAVDFLHAPLPNYRLGLAASYSALGSLLANTGRPREAEQSYREALNVAPDDAQALNGLAWLLATCAELEFRKPAESVALADKAVTLAPKQGACWNTLGVAQYRAGDWKAAVTALHRSIELREGGDGFDWFFLAMAHWRLGNKEEARKWYDQAVQWMEKNSPKNEEVRRFRGEAEALMKTSQ